MSRILNGVTDDLLQMISQYSMEVYFKLRLVSKAVKKVIDEVLPIGQTDKETRLYRSWQVKFLRRAHWCGFKLLDQRYFDNWMEAITYNLPYLENRWPRDLGDMLEKFCRDYLPKNGCIGQNALSSLCQFNRKDYVRELWEEAKHKRIGERFSPECIKEISMLKDFEFFKMVYDRHKTAFGNNETRKLDYIEAVDNAYLQQSWKNFRYLVEDLPILVNWYDMIDGPCFKIVQDYWKCLPDIKSQNKDKVTRAIKRNCNLLLFVDESFQKDKDVVMKVVKKHGKTIEFAHESLRKDRDIVMAAVKDTGVALQFAHETLRKDREIVMTAVKKNWWTLRYAHESLRKDREIVMAAVTKTSFETALRYADESLRKDREIVMKAVENQRFALEFAHESLRKDREIVIAAVKNHGASLEFAGRSLRKDKDIVLQAIGKNGNAFLYADESLEKDAEVVLKAFKTILLTSPSFQYVASLFQDEELLRKVVELDECFLSYADKSMKMDKEFVMRVVKLNRQSLQYADKSLQNDPDLQLLAAE